MELGKGFAFVDWQKHIHTEKEDYYIDGHNLGTIIPLTFGKLPKVSGFDCSVINLDKMNNA